MVLLRHLPEENAMKSTTGFVAQFAASIVAVLGCFDRVIFKGHLPFGNDAQLNRFVDGTLKMRRKDFLPWLQAHSDQLVAHAQALAQQHDAPYHYLQGHHRKEDLVQQTIRQRRLSEGLVCVLCCQETCRTVKLLYGQDKPRLTFRPRPQRVLYFYFLDPDFGLRYVRLQTCSPSGARVHLPGLCQRPRLAGPPTAPAGPRLRAAG